MQVDTLEATFFFAICTFSLSPFPSQLPSPTNAHAAYCLPALHETTTSSHSTHYTAMRCSDLLSFHASSQSPLACCCSATLNMLPKLGNNVLRMLPIISGIFSWTLPKRVTTGSTRGLP
ncbi:Os10g0539950 [Oryza sativa Japonica Group]|uniref:Os10g0539950 protein n=1 Tax=Oryza sativa subsp. japonica TaxID=39947 RepID=A0A0P0XX39_ORYSJ|nr:hypothetical protein EE612_052520 [Oryza sativa]BAT11856.1 Os10g0539950 [Oryza sativa Japonica Group]